MGRRRSRGQSLAEFALVIPIVILALMGLFDLGRAVFAYNSITNASREATRLAIVNQDFNAIQQRAFEQAPLAEQVANDSVEVFFSEPGSAIDAGDCDANPNVGGSQMGIGCLATVRYTSQFEAITPIIGGLVGAIDLVAESSVPIEFVCPNATVTAANCPKQP